MVRPGRRKCLEEVYGTKLDSIHPVKSHVATGMAITKSATMRTDRSGITGSTGGGGGANGMGMGMGIGGQGGAATSRKPDARTQRSFVTANDYYITTNLPLTASGLRNASSAMTQSTHGSNMSSGVQANPYASPYNAMSSRRGTMTGKATARQPQQPKVPHFSLPENKTQGTSSGMIKQKDQQHQHRLNGGHNKTMTQRSSYVTAALNAIDANTGTEFSDKELMLPAAGGGRTRRSHSHQHQHQRGHMHQHQHQHQQVQQTHPLQHQLHQQQQSNFAQTHNHVHPKHMHDNHPQNHQNPRQLKVHIPGQGPGMPVNKVQVSPADVDDDDDNESKDDDPDEFFELIRQTVQKAIGSTISEILNTNFRDLTHKMDRFNGELKMTNENLDKLQDQVTNKVVHYGEENSRHFRYLCMKSEYDKMFYQHQTMMAGKQLPTEPGERPSQLTVASQHPVVTSAVSGSAVNNVKPNTNFKYPTKLAKHFNAQKLNNNNLKKETIDGNKVQNPCACRTTSKVSHQQQQQQQLQQQQQQLLQLQQQTAETNNSVSDQSVSVKTSELDMREVLGHIQRFCTQMKLGDLKDNEQLSYDLEDVLKPKAGMSGKMGVNHSSEESTLKAVSSKGDRKDPDSDLETPVDSMDETYIEMDEFQFSSDMSSGSDDDSDTNKYPSGGTTARAPLKSTRMPQRSSHKGAGDGQ